MNREKKETERDTKENLFNAYAIAFRNEYENLGL